MRNYCSGLERNRTMEAQAETKVSGAATLPLIVLDDAVVFPHTVASVPLDKETAPAAEASLANGRYILLVARRQDADTDAPLALQLHRVGTLARVDQTGMLPNGVSGIVVRGVVRVVLG